MELWWNMAGSTSGYSLGTLTLKFGWVCRGGRYQEGGAQKLHDIFHSIIDLARPVFLV
jgi:myosin-crossreactive antigen